MVETCEYKLMQKGDTAKKIRRRFKLLTGKDAPQINHHQFTQYIPGKARPNTHKSYYTIKNSFVTHYHRNKHNIIEPVTDTLGLLIIARKYSRNMNMHSWHALSAVKHNNIIYGFNAWGKDGLEVDKDIFSLLKDIYNCNKYIKYNGRGLQNKDQHGVCVGYAANFVTEMFLLIHEGKLNNELNQNDFDTYIENKLKTRGICFGAKCITGSQMGINSIQVNLEKNLFTPSPNPLSTIKENNLSKMTLIQLKEYAKSKKMKGYSKYTKKKELKLFIERKNKENNINSLTLLELKKLAKTRKLKGYSKYTKKDNLKKFIKGL